MNINTIYGNTYYTIWYMPQLRQQGSAKDFSKLLATNQNPNPKSNGN